MENFQTSSDGRRIRGSSRLIRRYAFHFGLNFWLENLVCWKIRSKQFAGQKKIFLTKAIFGLDNLVNNNNEKKLF